MIKYFPAITGISLMATLNYNIKYFPSIAFTLNSEYQFGEYHISWYKKNSIIHHPNLLISYGHKPSEPLKKYVNNDNMMIMGDSGGFQTITSGIQFDPRDVIEWFNQNCNIGFTLDIPPVDINNGGMIPVNNDEFTKRMNKSNENANIMMSKKSNDLKLYLVIQGFNNKDRQRWLDGGLKEYQNWDGYALSPKPQFDSVVLANFILFAKDNNLKNIHLLGISGSNTLPIIVYLSKYFDSVYFDSSSYAFGSRQRIYTLPYSNNRMLLSSLKENNGIPKVLPCDCPVCSKIKDTSIFNSNENTGIAGWLINMHNLYNTQRYLTFLEGIVHDKDLFLSQVSQTAQDTIKYIDDKLIGKKQVTF